MTPVSISTRERTAREQGLSADIVSSQIVGRFLEARRTAGGLDAYPGDLPATLEDAYAIQDEAIARWGRPVLGWKVGLVPEPLSDRFGTERLAGPIFARANASTDGAAVEMPVFAAGFAAAEAEFLLRIGASPAAGQVAFSLDETADLVESVHAGIEIASSPLRSINELGPVAVISDFGNNNGLVVGPEIPDWRSSGFADWEVRTAIDGDVAGIGCGAAFPDGPIGAARFLFELMARRGIALAPGQWISSGAVTGVHAVRPGQVVEAQFREDLSLTCKLVAAHPQ
jgi:2-keto-4-pentenoate hydratase